MFTAALKYYRLGRIYKQNKDKDRTSIEFKEFKLNIYLQNSNVPN